MATVAQVDARYTADTSQYVRAVRQAQQATQNLAGTLPDADKSMGDLKASTVALGAAMGTLGAQAITKTIGYVKQFAMQGINAAKDYEQTVISIEGIFQGMGMSVGEATEKTKSYLADLRDFAAETPFELPQTLDAVKRLLSIGYAADDVKDQLLPAIGDIVSALGQPPQSISAVVYAFGQMKSAGRVLSQDLMQIGNALPGFNAKVAIAEQLFSGDMKAMSEAMEKGSLDSETAIQAIIKAMQEFPGAAGAMERQSKTLAGVMSTFSDTVNNALIDGLMPAMPMLSEALNSVMPAVESLATAFAQKLGPTLVDGAGLMGELVPVATELIPPIFDLIDAFTGMADIIAVFIGPVTFIAKLLGDLISVFDMLPGPVQTAIGVLVTLRLLMMKYPAAFAAMRVGATTAFTTMKAGAMTAAGGVLVSLTNMRVGMELVKVTAKGMGTGIVAGFRMAGVAAKGFMASLGPVGIALAAAAVAFEVFSGKGAEAEALVARMKDTVDETTGALTEMSAVMIGSQFRMDLSGEDQAAIAALGVGINEATAAIMAGGDAAEAFNQKIQAAIDSSAGTQRDLLITWQRNYQGMMDASNETARQVANDQASEQAARAATAEKARSDYFLMMDQQRQKQVEAGIALQNMTTQEKIAASQKQELAAQEALLSGVVDATAAAVRALSDAYSELSGIISNTRAEDRAHDALVKMREQLESNTDGLKGYKGEAQANRTAVLDYADAQMALAQSLQDPQAEMDALIELQTEVLDSMKASGMKNPKQSQLYQDISGAIKAAEDEIDNMDTAVANAEKMGLDTTAAIAAGIEAGMEEQVSAINAAGIVAGDALADGTNQALGISSPSRVAMEAGRNTGLGLIEGLNQMRTAAGGAGMNVGAEIVRGMLTSLQNGVGPIAAAARRIVAAAIAAAKEEGGIASPSKVFYEIGDNLTKGLRLGAMRNAGSFVDDMARMVQDAVFAVEDATDRVNDARKALKEVRAEHSKGKASAREVAAAQRELTLALRDQADAAEAAKEAQRNLRAQQKLAKMKPTDISAIKKSMAESIKENGTFGDAWDEMSQVLYNRARRAGMTREAAQAYVDSVMGTVEKKFEKDLQRLEKLQKRLAKIRQRIADLEEIKAEREGARSDIEKLLESRFGQPSEFKAAYDSASVSVDQAISLFDRMKDLVETRLGGSKADEERSSSLVAFLESETQKLVDLIKKRDALAPELAKQRAELERLISEKSSAEKTLADSIRGFSKISGSVSSADEYIVGLEQRVAATKKYIADIETLRKRGLSKAVIEQILAAGPESGGSFAAALSQATDEQLKYVNELTGQTETMAEEFGKTQASVMYDAGIAAQQALVNGLQSQMDDLLTEIDSIVAGIEAQLAPLAQAGTTAGDALIDETLATLQEREQEVLDAIAAIGEKIAAAWEKAMTPVTSGAGTTPASGGPNPNKNRRSAYVPSAVPAVTSSSAINVASGGVQVQVSVGSGASSTTEDAVKSAVMDALKEVAAQAAGARR